MIFGVGTDICELVRVQQTYDRFGDHFVRRMLIEKLKNCKNKRQKKKLIGRLKNWKN